MPGRLAATVPASSSLSAWCRDNQIAQKAEALDGTYCERSPFGGHANHLSRFDPSRCPEEFLRLPSSAAVAGQDLPPRHRMHMSSREIIQRFLYQLHLCLFGNINVTFEQSRTETL